MAEGDEMQPASALDMDDVWRGVVDFQQKVATTTGSIHSDAQEKQLVAQFLPRVPFEALFAGLEDASVRGDKTQVLLLVAFFVGPTLRTAIYSY